MNSSAALSVLVALEVDTPHPVTFGLQALHQMASDETSRAGDQYSRFEITHVLFPSGILNKRLRPSPQF